MRQATSTRALRRLQRAAPHIRQVRCGAPWRVVVIGEFNAGKTTLINALLGEALLPTSVVANTRLVTVVSFAASARMSLEHFDRTRATIDRAMLARPAAQVARRLHIALPHAALKTLCLIDTPGLAAGDATIEHHIHRALSRADVVVWCTPAMQAWKATEQTIWLGLPERIRSKGILAITFADAIGSSGDAARLIARLNAEAGPYFAGIVRMPGIRRTPEGKGVRAPARQASPFPAAFATRRS
jgi:GTPase Era involved in 16S rRNA processing